MIRDNTADELEHEVAYQGRVQRRLNRRSLLLSQPIIGPNSSQFTARRSKNNYRIFPAISSQTSRKTVGENGEDFDVGIGRQVNDNGMDDNYISALDSNQTHRRPDHVFNSEFENDDVYNLESPSFIEQSYKSQNKRIKKNVPTKNYIIENMEALRKPPLVETYGTLYTSRQQKRQGQVWKQHGEAQTSRASADDVRFLNLNEPSSTNSMKNIVSTNNDSMNTSYGGKNQQFSRNLSDSGVNSLTTFPKFSNQNQMFLQPANAKIAVMTNACKKPNEQKLPLATSRSTKPPTNADNVPRLSSDLPIRSVIKTNDGKLIEVQVSVNLVESSDTKKAGTVTNSLSPMGRRKKHAGHING